MSKYISRNFPNQIKKILKKFTCSPLRILETPDLEVILISVSARSDEITNVTRKRITKFR